MRQMQTNDVDNTRNDEFAFDTCINECIIVRNCIFDGLANWYNDMYDDHIHQMHINTISGLCAEYDSMY